MQRQPSDHSSIRRPKASAKNRQPGQSLTFGGRAWVSPSREPGHHLPASRREPHVEPGRRDVGARLAPKPSKSRIVRRQIRTPGLKALEAALAKVRLSPARLDKHHVLLAQRPSHAQMKVLRRLAGKYIKVRDAHPTAALAGWPYVLPLQRPSEKLLQAISMLGSHANNRVEIFRDAEADDPADLARLYAALKKLIVCRRLHELHPIFKFARTTYFTRRRAARGVCMYDDLASKIGAGRCLHTEHRLRRKVTLERVGLSTVDRLTPANLKRTFDDGVRLVDILDRDKLRHEVAAIMEESIRENMPALEPGEDASKLAAAVRQHYEVEYAGNLFNNVDPDFAKTADWGQAPTTNLVYFLPELVRHRLLQFDLIIA